MLPDMSEFVSLVEGFIANKLIKSFFVKLPSLYCVSPDVSNIETLELNL